MHSKICKLQAIRFITVLLIASFHHYNGLTQSIQWATRTYGSGNEQGRGITTDLKGNIYVVYSFTGSMSIGSSTITSNGGADILLTKYSCSGSLIWTRKIGSTQDDYSYNGLAIDSNENVTIAGYFQGTVSIQNTTGSTTLTSSGGYDILLVSYNSVGNLRWSRAEGGTGTDNPYYVTNDGNGNIYITGQFTGTCIIANTTLISGGNYDGFLSKYDSTGSPQWAVKFTSSSADVGVGVDVDLKTGNVYVVGHYGNPSASTTFTTTSGSSITKSNSGNWDGFLAKYSSNGVLKWVQTMNGSAQHECNAVEIDGSGNPYAVYNYTGTGNFSSSNGTVTSPSSHYGNYDFAIVKYDSNGLRLWVKIAGSSGSDVPYAIKNHNDSFYIVGNFTNSLTWGSNSVTSAGSSDAFVVIIDSSGSYKTPYRFGNSSGENLFSITLDTCRNPIVSGFYNDTVYYGTFKLGSNGGNNAVLARFGTKYNADLQIINNDSIICTNSQDSIIITIRSIPNGSYQWLRNNQAISSANDTFYSIKNSGSYKVLIMGSCCFYDSSRSLEIISHAPSINLKDTFVCKYDSVPLNPSGNPNYIYSWSPGSPLYDSSLINPLARPLETTTFYLKTQDQFNCITYDTLTVTVHQPPSLNAGNDTSFCNGDSVRLLASGTGTFLWSPPYGLSSTNSSNPFARGTKDTSYAVRLTSSFGCNNWDTIRVKVHSIPQLNAGIDTAICQFDSIQLNATGSGSFKWNSNSYISNDSIRNPFIKPLVSSSYFLRLTDSNKCIKRDTLLVTVLSLPSIYAGPDTSYCLLDSIRLNAQGTGDWLWTPGNDLSKDTIRNPNHKSAVANTYTYRVRLKGANGCFNYDTLNIIVKALPNANAGSDTGFCLFDSLVLNATGGVNYLWTPSASLNDSTISNPISKASSNQLYKLKVTGSNGCYKYDSIYVTVHPLPIAVAGNDTIICNGTNIRLSGSGSADHLWRPLSNFNISDSLIYNPELINIGPAKNEQQNQTLAYRTRSDKGCVDWDTLTVRVRPDSALPAPRLNCLSIQNNKAVLKWSKPVGLEDFVAYNVYRQIDDTGIYTKVKIINDSNVQDWIDSSIYNFDSQSYSYFIRTERFCNQFGLVGDTLRTLLLKGDKISFEHSTLIWNSLNNRSNKYTIEYENGSFTNYDSTNFLSYNIYLTNCKLRGNFRIYTKDTFTNCTSYSNKLFINLNDSIPPSITKINYLTVQNNGIRLNIRKSDSSDAFKYYIHKSVNGSALLLFDSLGDFTDSNVNWVDSFTDSRYNYYMYSVEVKDSCGNSAGLSIPHRNIILRADTNGCDQTIQLSWNKYINFPSGINSFQLYRSNGTGIPVHIKTLSSTDSSYIDTILNYDRYTYFLVAIENGSGYQSTSSDTSKKSFEPLAPDILSVSKLNTSVSNGNIFIKWNSGQASKIRELQLHVKSVYDSSFRLLQSFSPDTDSFIHSNINTRDSDYFYYLLAIDSCGNISKPSRYHKTMNIRVDIGQLQHRVNWSPYRGYDSILYVIEKFNGSSFISMDTVSNDTMVNYFPAPCNVPIYYRIKALIGTSISYSDTMGRPALDTVYPNAVSTHNISVINNNHVKLEFTGSDSTDVYGYTIYRSDNNSNWTQAGFILYQGPGVAISFNDTVSNFTDDHCYVIVTVDSCLNSKFSDTICHINLEGSAQNLGDTLFWSAFKKYELRKYFIETKVNNVWTVLDSLSSNILSYKHSPLPCRINQYYRIRGMELNGTRFTYSDSIILTPFDTLSPSIPYVKYVTVLNQSDIEIAWNRSDPKAIFYEIQGKSSSGTWNSIDTINSDTIAVLHSLSNADSAYCFRVIAIDTCQANRSLASPPHCTMQLQGNAKNTANFLNWSSYQGFNPVKKYYIEELINGNWNRIDSNKANLSYTHQPLTCNIAKTYRIAAVDSLKNWVSHSDTITLIPFDTIKPQAPDLLYASVIDNSTVGIRWKLSDPKVLIYEIQLKTPTQGWQAIDTLGVDSLYTINNLNTLDSSYCFRVVAIDSCQANRSIASNEHCTIELRAIPENLASYLSWRKYYGFNPVVKYYIELLIGSNWIVKDSVSGSDSAYNHGPLICNVPHQYRIKAIDSRSYISYSDTVHVIPFDTIKPLAVKLISVNVIQPGTVHISWNKSKSEDVKYYDIYRRSYGNFYKLNTVTLDTFYVDVNNNTSDSTWSYHIIAIDSCNSSNRSITSDVARITHLEKPTSGNCIPIIGLSWKKYQGFDQYLTQHLQRSINGGSFIDISTLSGLDSLFTDTVTDNGIKSCYRVRNHNTLTGAMSYSDTVCLEPFVFPSPNATEMLTASVTVTGTSNGENKVSWRRSPLNDTFAQGYNIYHSNGSAFSLIHKQNDINDTDYLHKNVNTKSSINKYYITTYNLCDKEGDSSKIHKTINLELKPQNLAAGLQWTKYEGFIVKSYEVLRSEDNKPFQIIYAGIDTMYTDSTQRCLHNYAYLIRAYDNSNLLVESDTVKVLAFDSIPPGVPIPLGVSITYTSQNIGKAKLTFTNQPENNFSSYKIYRKTDLGSFVLVNTINNKNNGVISFDDAGLNTETFNYTYYLQAIDSCGNVSDASAIHRSIHLSATATDNNNIIQWNSYPAWTNYTFRLQRKSQNNNWITISNLSPSILNYKDSITDCDSIYYYRIEAINDSNLFSILSNEDSAVAFELTQPLTNEITKASVIKTGITTGEIEISWNNSASTDVLAYNIFRRTQNSSNWNLIGNQANNTVYTDKNLNTQNLSYNYRIQVVDSCRNTSFDFSETHKSINLKTIPENERIILTWNHYQGWPIQIYNVYRGTDLLGTTPGTDSFYIDTMVRCDSIYTYYVEAVNNNNLLIKSLSNISGAQPFDITAASPIILNYSSVTAHDSIVEVAWQPSAKTDVIEYEVYRSINGGNWKLINTQSIATNIFNDTLDIQSRNICYTIVAKDLCGNRSLFSNPGCIIIPKANGIHQKNHITWNAYHEWSTGVAQYMVYRSDDGGPFLLIGSTNQTQYMDDNLNAGTKTFTYRIEAIENGPWAYISRSTLTSYKQKPTLYIPNTFSPNADGINDLFGPAGTWYESFTMDIYNRWGERIFSSTNSGYWDGTYRGKDVPDGVYFYIITLNGYQGTKNTLSGDIFLVR